MLTILKGTPSAYNKDLQEDKEPLFDAIDTLTLTLPVATGIVSTLHVNEDRTSAAITDGMLATELADYLVSKGVPFRESHRLVGQAVRRAEKEELTLVTLPLEEYQAIDARFDQELYSVLDARRAVARRDVPCGTSPRAVSAQIARARALLP
jgi:argininosuccinate lyase